MGRVSSDALLRRDAEGIGRFDEEDTSEFHKNSILLAATAPTMDESMRPS
jgi:hypothetical protein